MKYPLCFGGPCNFSTSFVERLPGIIFFFSLFIYFLFSATKELHSPDGDSTTAPPSQSSEQSEVKNKVDFVLNPLQITSCSDVGSPPQTPSVKKIKKVCYLFLFTLFSSVTSMVEFCRRELTKGFSLAKKSAKEKYFFNLTFTYIHMGYQKVPKAVFQSHFPMSDF